ncbi:MAG TPA: hypothetical protein VHV55_14100 [Pirellulales bacterium]|nr:hypothetical protein [Pirellulales bacterium]
METAANATTGTPPSAGNWQRTPSGPKPAVSSGIPHVLARLPDLRVTRQQTAEPARSQAFHSQPITSQPAVSQPVASAVVERPASRWPPAPIETGEDSKSEFFEPQGLPAIDRVWQDTRHWIAKHAKVAMFVVALVASHSLMLLWHKAPVERQPAPIMQPLGTTLDTPALEQNQLNPIAMDSEAAVGRVPAADSASTPVIDEPHLALPRPQPDPISMTAPPRPGVPDELAEEPKLAAAVKPDASPSEHRDHQHDQHASAIGGSMAKPAVPTIDEKDVPPWENWSSEKSSPALTSPTAEAAAQTTPALTPPDGSSTIAKLPDDERTASLSADRPSSRAGSMQRPRAVAKLKGTINKPLAEPANERTRRSLY